MRRVGETEEPYGGVKLTEIITLIRLLMIPTGLKLVYWAVPTTANFETKEYDGSSRFFREEATMLLLTAENAEGQMKLNEIDKPHVASSREEVMQAATMLRDSMVEAVNRHHVQLNLALTCTPSDMRHRPLWQELNDTLPEHMRVR